MYLPFVNSLVHRADAIGLNSLSFFVVVPCDSGVLSAPRESLRVAVLCMRVRSEGLPVNQGPQLTFVFPLPFIRDLHTRRPHTVPRPSLPYRVGIRMG